MPTHAIWSVKPRKFTDGATGTTYTAEEMDGGAIGKWIEGTHKQRFEADLSVAGEWYSFAATHIENSSADRLTGRWKVERNGTTVATDVDGRVEGLSGPAGLSSSVFSLKIYDPPTWKLEMYTTARIDAP